MKILDLPLKKEWYEMIESGIKTEEYREVKPYWEKRLLDYAAIKANITEIFLRKRTWVYPLGKCLQTSV